ncbi:MAG TPA: HAMP domain-containing sensor histidine kinase [Bacteroidales bacterium]|nr:HAMP domain-containing sensor histidine kinase [Bacteroidales bacterium]
MVQISDDVTMNRERLNTMGSQASVNGLSLEKFSGDLNQFCKLIEYDEGIPFQLVFGKEPGEGCYQSIGKGIEKITGVSSSAFTEKALMGMMTEIIPLSENMPVNFSEIRKAVLDGRLTNYKLEMRIVIPDGSERWIRETSIALRDEYSGKVWGIMGIYHDITERKLVIAYLNEAREKASESERLKTTFLQNISHEVRTPLNAIVGFSTLLCEPEEEYCRRQECVSMLSHSTDHFLELMDNIMEISRIEAGSAQTVVSDVNPAELVSKIYGIFKMRAEEQGIKMGFSIPDDIPVIRTDGFKLLQVMTNLVGNAVKFTPSGKIEFGCRDYGKSVGFYVSDTGIGIPEDHKQKVFNKFYQADSGTTRRFPGVGLGLSIARAYVEMLGGSISFDSEEGAGTTFNFTIPKQV